MYDFVYFPPEVLRIVVGSILPWAQGSLVPNPDPRHSAQSLTATLEVEYWEESESGAHPPGRPYEGSWTPNTLRSELAAALTAKFPRQVDTSGSTAIQVHSGTARVDADVVPCFSYAYYLPASDARRGTKLFTTNGNAIVDYPRQQLENGRAKNHTTGSAFKKTVRILKRVENAMADAGTHRDLPSYFIECLVYNCPNSVFESDTWTELVREALIHIWDGLQGEEPVDEAERWLEVNECFFLFHPRQKMEA